MAQKPNSSKDAFNQAADPNQEKYTKVNNVPDNSSISNDPLSLTIFGTQGGKVKFNAEIEDQKIEGEFVPEEPELMPVNLSTDDVSLDWEENGYRILVKQEDHQSDQGIDGGRITRLAMTNEEGTQVYFDNGEWQEEPDLPVECEMVDNIKDDLNHAPEPEKTPEPPKSNEHDHDI